jgi:hypothetical protein
LLSLLLLFTGYAFSIQASRPVEEPIWCTVESLGRQLKDKAEERNIHRQVPIYVAEDDLAYHLWFALRGRSQIGKLIGVPGTLEDKAFFLPRGFDGVSVIPVEQLDADEFWFVYRTKTRDVDQPPLSYFFDRDYFIYDEQDLEGAYGYKIIAVLMQKRHSLTLYDQTIDHGFTREAALLKMKACEIHIDEDCLDAADFLMRLQVNGDDALLSPLLDAGIKSDGAYSESLGPYYSDVLQLQMDKFLSGINGRSRKEQQTLCFLAIAADGSGNGDHWEADVGSKLLKIKEDRSSSLSGAASVCLSELQWFQAQPK